MRMTRRRGARHVVPTARRWRWRVAGVGGRTRRLGRRIAVDVGRERGGRGQGDVAAAVLRAVVPPLLPVVVQRSTRVFGGDRMAAQH